jgi:hypothetical protein
LEVQAREEARLAEEARIAAEHQWKITPSSSTPTLGFYAHLYVILCIFFQTL